MQVFEYNINPELKKDFTSETITLNPKNIYGKRLGCLFIISSLSNAFFQKEGFLTELLTYIKEKYYKSAVKTPEKALKTSLVEVNSFLENKNKEGNTEWLGNLGLIALTEKANKINFSKIGKSKLLLFRGNEITDVDNKIKQKKNSIKFFGDIVSAKLAKEDCLLLLTKEIYDFFKKEDLLEEIARVAITQPERLETFINTFEEKMYGISGSFLIIVSEKEKRFLHEKKILKFERKEKEKRIFSFLNFFKKINFSKMKIAKKPVFRIPEMIFNKKTKKMGLIFISSILLIAVIFFLIQLNNRNEIKKYSSIISELETKIDETNSIENQEEQEAILFNILDEYNNYFENNEKNFSSEIIEKKEALNEKIYNRLYELNFGVLLYLEPLASFDSNENLTNIIADNNETYVFNKNKVYKVTSEENKLIAENLNIKISLLTDSGIIFISRDLNIYKENNDSLQKVASLSTKYDLDPTVGTSYVNNLYFLDKNKGNILKYSNLSENSWAIPEYWFEEDGIIDNSKGVTIDKNIWILKNDNTLEKYYLGELMDTISIETFPTPTNFTKIFTAKESSYIYVLEGSNNRILVIDKEGKIIKQYISNKLSEALDFSIDLDNNLIRILSKDLKIYQIEL